MFSKLVTLKIVVPVLNRKGLSITILFLLFTLVKVQTGFSQCNSLTPSFTLDLTGSPNASSVTPNSSRNGTCCGGNIPCVKIVVLLNPNAMALKLTPTGADPGGALTYEFNCDGNQIPGGTPICLPTNITSCTLTICKVGNNPNSYSVESIPKPFLPDSIFIRSGCSQTLATIGFSLPTVTWGSINGGTNTTLFNSYLNCTAGCGTVVVTPSGTVPVAFVDYTVGGYGVAPCETGYFKDTVRVFFFNNLAAPLTNTTICFGNISAVLSPTATGGKPAYTYSWSTGSTSQSITVGAGTYTLRVGDATGCPPITNTVLVTNFTVPITANAGPTQTLCKSNPNIPLQGSVTGVSTGIWTGGTGSFVPSTTLLSTSYVPSPAEVSTGSVQLYLTTTNNLGCSPQTGTVSVFFQNSPTVAAGADMTVCANNNVSTFTASISGFSSTALWSSSGSGTFSILNNTVTSYTPSAGDISTGSVNVIVTTTNNGACPLTRDTVKIIITPKPSVNAGPNQTICSIYAAPLSATITGGATTGSWTTSGNGTFTPNNTALTATYVPGSLDLSSGTVSLFLTSTNNGNCFFERDTVVISIRNQATVNAGSNYNVCSVSPAMTLSGTVGGATNTGSWSVNGSGAFSQPVTGLTNTYTASGGDIGAGFVIFTLTSTNNGPCPAVTDSVRINVQTLAALNAGSSQTICAIQNSVSLNGNILAGPGTATWSTNGTGGFTTPVSSISPVYTLSSGDINLGSVTFTLRSTNNGVCPAVQSTVGASIIRQATVNAGVNLNVCSSTGTVPLTGTITGGTSSGIWSVNGTGQFQSATSSISNTYSMSAGDISAGFVIFTLTSTNNGPCPAQTDSVRINFQSIAQLNAGNSQTICSSQNTVGLNGSIFTSPGTVSWTASGTGTFLTPVVSMAPVYSISGTDANTGVVIFTITSTNNGACPAVQATVAANITKQATVNAGLNQVYCSNAVSLPLSGTVTSGSGQGNWSTSGGGNIQSPGNLATSYSLNPADAAAGTIVFSLTSQSNGPCPSVTDTVRIRIITLASVNAGTYAPICSTQSLLSLSGAVTGVSGLGTWTTNGSGTIAQPNSLFTSYSISPADIQNGLVSFTLSSINNGPCPVIKDVASLQIIKTATVNAGVNQSICSNTTQVALSGTMTGGASGILWTADGTGLFTPGTTVSNPVYNITPQNIQNGSVTFTLTSTGNGPCPAVSDSVRIEITRPATVSAGSNQVFCSSASTIALNGNVNSSSFTGSWTANGTGTFTGNDQSVSTVYQLSQDDILNGIVIFTLTSTNNKTCPKVTDTVTVRIQRAAVVNAGKDFTICSTQPNINITGSITGVTSSGTWTTTGTGTLTPASSGLSMVYSITGKDIQNGGIIFELTSTNNGICPARKDTVLVKIITFPIVSIQLDTTICENKKPFRVQAVLFGGSGQFVWSSTGTGSFTPGNNINPTHYLFGAADPTLQSIEIRFTSINNGNCNDVSATTRIDILPTPKASFTPSSYTLTLPRESVVLTNTSKGAKSYKWIFGDGTEEFNRVSPTHLYTKVGYFSPMLIATNEFGCKDTAQETLTIISDIAFPNAFTPNPGGPNGGKYDPRDLSNDIFFPYTDGIVDYKLSIFNRWGEQLFESRDLSIGWDGYFNGKLCQQDAYVWKASGTFFDGRTFEQVGTVTLLR